MTLPNLFGFPIDLLFLYFVIYSFLGWIMETTYCSICEKRFVVRGFLYGPICPIYGVGVLMMICWFAPFTDRPVLFYLVSVVCMSAWEYFVGWFLETTTHIKYWDYSMFRFNLHGRICLWVSLTWGVLSYLVIFWLHPLVAGLILKIPLTLRHILTLVSLCLLLVDAVITIRSLALVTKMLTKLKQMSDQLQLQLSLGKAEFSDWLDETRDSLSDRLDGVKSSLSGKLDVSSISALRDRYNELLEKAERQSRHFRHTYSRMSSKSLSGTLEQVFAAGRRKRKEREEKRALRKAKKNAQ